MGLTTCSNIDYLIYANNTAEIMEGEEDATSILPSPFSSFPSLILLSSFSFLPLSIPNVSLLVSPHFRSHHSLSLLLPFTFFLPPCSLPFISLSLQVLLLFKALVSRIAPIPDPTCVKALALFACNL